MRFAEAAAPGMRMLTAQSRTELGTDINPTFLIASHPVSLSESPPVDCVTVCERRMARRARHSVPLDGAASPAGPVVPGRRRWLPGPVL